MISLFAVQQLNLLMKCKDLKHIHIKRVLHIEYKQGEQVYASNLWDDFMTKNRGKMWAAIQKEGMAASTILLSGWLLGIRTPIKARE